MLMVYKITNLVNQKSYIGSTIRGWKRIEEHKKDAFNSKHKHYNYPLYQAFRKYGLNNFSFEILRNDFQDIDEMQQYEHDMIIFYNSLKNGYNQTLETRCALQDKELKKQILQKVSQPCALVDSNQNIIQTFSSFQEAARKMGLIGQASTIRNVCLGKQSSINGKYYRLLDSNNQVIQIDIKPYKNKKNIIAIDLSIHHNDLYFDSILAAATELNLNRTSIQQCIKGSKRYWIVGGYLFRQLDDQGNIIENNYLSVDAAQKEYNRLNPIIDNNQHNITEWCKIYNISRESYYKRLKKGMSVIDAITTPKRK